MVKELFASIVVITLMVLFENTVDNTCFLPIALGAMSLAQGVMGGMAASAKAERENQEAIAKWGAATVQKAWNNSKAQLEAVQQFENQLKKNRQISESAFSYNYDAKEAAKVANVYRQEATYHAATAGRAALTSSVGARGISAKSGSTTAMLMAQARSMLDENEKQEVEFDQQIKNIDTQTKNMMNQRSENVFIADFQGYDAAPQLQDTQSPLIGGIMSGVSGAFGGMLTGAQLSNEMGSGGIGGLFGASGGIFG